MKKIITFLFILSFITTKAQDSNLYVMSHYLTDGSTSNTFNEIRFLMFTNGNYSTLYVKEASTDKWLIEDYPLELIETGFKEGGVYFEKFNISKSSSTFIEATKKYETRGYYFFFDKKRGNIKSIVEVIIYSKNNIITKRYYP